MNDLDFSILTDDQLVSLIRAACAEAVSRSPAIQQAAQSAVLDESTKGRIAAEAARQEAERLVRDESARVARDAADRVRREAAEREQKEKEEKIAARFQYEKEVLAELATALGDTAGEKKWWIEIWTKGGEKRAYVGTRGVKFGQNEIGYYHTGKLSRHDQKDPGTIEAHNPWRARTDVLAAVKSLLARLCEKHTQTIFGSK